LQQWYLSLSLSLYDDGTNNNPEYKESGCDVSLCRRDILKKEKVGKLVVVPKAKRKR
jgi:hypothetical protein